ncbi:hypothetical protein JOL62DRAFT_89997 [Phyllosticta paracitricarpa]|uniref:Uncharacterized protein n=1 Tax=Phyllosticta paracitricarpa TaxID=2016321 RepID=A0ABR1N7D2_9PEZI
MRLLLTTKQFPSLHVVPGTLSAAFARPPRRSALSRNGSLSPAIPVQYLGTCTLPTLLLLAVDFYPVSSSFVALSPRRRVVFFSIILTSAAKHAPISALPTLDSRHRLPNTAICRHRPQSWPPHWAPAARLSPLHDSLLTCARPTYAVRGPGNGCAVAPCYSAHLLRAEMQAGVFFFPFHFFFFLANVNTPRG